MNTPVFSFASSVRSRSDFAATVSRYFWTSCLPIRCRQLIDHRMLRREDHVVCAIERVRPGSEDANARIGFALPGDRKINLRPFAAADPIGLQKLYSLRPIEAVQFRQSSRSA